MRTSRSTGGPSWTGFTCERPRWLDASTTEHREDLYPTCPLTAREWCRKRTRGLLLRVDAVDGADHPLVEFLLKPPPLRFGPGIRRKDTFKHGGRGMEFWVMRGDKRRSESPFSSLEVVLPHRNVLKPESDLLMTDNCLWECAALAPTYSCVDLAIVGGHAVSMVEVGEGFGCAPGLQVPGHSDRRPHLAAVHRGTRAHVQQRAVPLSLGTERHGWVLTFWICVACWLTQQSQSTSHLLERWSLCSWWTITSWRIDPEKFAIPKSKSKTQEYIERFY